MKRILFLVALFAMGMGMNLKAQLIWSDEFNGSISGNWAYETGGGGWGNAELEYYRQQNATCQNNCLVITAKKESYGGYAYTSARMHTIPSWKFGFFETKATLPATSGMWPGFWMLGSNIGSVGWPSCGEIDIMENVNGNNTVYGTMHWNVNGHVSYGGNTNTTITGSHYYQVNWNTNAIKWYVDGNCYCTANISNKINNTGCFQNNFYILINMAVGGNWPGNNIGALPASFWLDYVRVYQASSATKSAINGVVNYEPTFNANGSFKEFVAETTTGINSVEASNIEMYPSILSKSGMLNIKLNQYDASANVTIHVFNMAGQCVINKIESSSQISFNPGLNSGLYSVKITNGSTTSTYKLVIK
jgi:beta-glucanase (GH16 family)